ncbi:MAG: peroxiredoxin [Actinomycetota bacterium]
MAAEVGSPAPDFTLQGIDRSAEGAPAIGSFSLADFRGGPVVLVFYPGDNTPVCTRQLNSYTDDFEAFSEVGAQVLAISPQSVESHEEFSCKQGGFAFPLLADTDKAVGSAYGILGPLGFYRRSVFVVDAEGIIRYAHRAVAGLTFRSAEDLVEAVRAAS